MDVDLATTVAPYLSAAVAAYGGAVLAKVRDRAADGTADATVETGRRLLRSILARGEDAAPVSTAVQDLAGNPADADGVAALRVQLRKLFTTDPAFAAEVGRLVGQATVTVTASGPRSIAAHTISGVAITGDGTEVAR